MSELPRQVIVATFSTEKGADEALKELKIMQREKLVQIIEAAMLDRDLRNNIRIKEVHEMSGGKGALAGGIIGTAIALMAGPASLIVGAATGALIGGLTARHVDTGLSNAQLKNLGETLEPGTSMLVAIIEHTWLSGMRESLQNSGAQIVMAEPLRQELLAKFGDGDTGFSTYVDGSEVAAEAGLEAANRLELRQIAAGDDSVVVRTHVLAKEGLVSREITINEHGISTKDTPVSEQKGTGDAQVTLEQLEEEAEKLTRSVSDFPESRYKLRSHFYSIYGRGKRTSGFGNSELNFIRWEINRGVLNRLEDPQQPGSPWWREVNSRFLYYAELALMLEQAGLGDMELPTAVRYWIDYMRAPGSETWYRAHNRSIFEGYILYESLAKQENEYEQFFMNEVLFRVIYASSMVMGRSFGALGKVMSNPVLPAVDLLVSIPHFYPHSYPMTFTDKMHILHNGYSLRKRGAQILDQTLVLPQLTALYEWSAEWLELPELPRYIIDDKPSYPIRAAA